MFYSGKLHHILADSCKEIQPLDVNVIFTYESPPNSNGRYNHGVRIYISCVTGFQRFGPYSIFCASGRWSRPSNYVKCIPNNKGKLNSM